MTRFIDKQTNKQTKKQARICDFKSVKNTAQN